MSNEFYLQMFGFSGFGQAGRLRARREPLEAEAVARQAADRECRDQGAGAGHRDYPDTARPTGPDQGEAGVADQRRTGIRDQGQRLPGAQQLDDPLARLLLVVLVQ